jgi:tripartite-type tricarboxylate transporter receptor subunit TctC
MKRIAAAALLVLGFGLAFAANAQTYPVKPIRFVVPFAPGGSSEIVARSIAAEMSKLLGQQVFVENKPGGAGNVAMGEVAKADPDGYTLILGHIGTLAVNPYMFEKLPYDANKDFVPISLLAIVPSVFVVNASVPAKDLKEFVKLAKDNPGKITYGSAGNGSAGHLAFEYLKLAAQIDLLHIPYKGTGPQLTDLLGGRLDAAAAGAPPLLPHIKGGKLRAIAVGTPQRIAALPDVATVAEQGYPGFETSQWYGLMAPAKTPEAIVKRLADAAAQAAKSPAVIERFAADNAVAVGSTPAEFTAYIRKEQARWKEVVEKAKIRPE